MQSFSAIWIHIIWSTKNREPLITKKLKYKLYDKIRMISEDRDYYLDHINGIEDHIHCLFSLKPKFSVSEVAKNVKGASSFWVNENKIIDEYFDWQNGFSAFSVSPSHVNRVRNYIRNQEKHHTEINYTDEIRKLKGLSEL